MAVNQSSSGNQNSIGSGSEQRRKELADFLRTRREKLKPEQVGITQGARRRTPGLRREEVAEIAGVGTTWYTWLEQARDIQPSGEVLRRLGQALQLTPVEMRHLFALAGKAMPAELEGQDEVVSDSLMRLLNRALGVPAVLVGSRWDVLEVNEHAKATFPHLSNLVAEKKNWVHFSLCGSDEKNRVINWEECARRMIAEFRASVSDSLDNPWVVELIDSLKRDSAEFEKWWREHDVRDNTAMVIDMIDTQGKKVRFERVALKPWQNQRFRILVFTPVNESLT